jgi:hypothetical protein
VTMTARLGQGVQARNLRHEVWGPPGTPTSGQAGTGSRPRSSTISRANGV